MNDTRRWMLAVLVSSFILHPSSFLNADGGRLWRTGESAHQRVSVFVAAAEPLTLDVSVLVQNPQGKVLFDVPVTVRAESESHSAEAVATGDLATNKLLQAAHLALPHPGRWQLVIRAGDVELAGPLDVEPPSDSWGLLPWIAWPFAVVAVFLLLRLRRGLIAVSSRSS